MQLMGGQPTRMAPDLSQPTAQEKTKHKTNKTGRSLFRQQVDSQLWLTARPYF
jgi:hypothetical protein